MLYHYSCVFDDYQGLILINHFLANYYQRKGSTSKAMHFYHAAIELSTHAGYTFFMVFLQKNYPDTNKDNIAEADKIIQASGFNPSHF